MTIKRRALKLSIILFLIILFLPEFAKIPVQGASSKDWNLKAFWAEPWGKSGVHKGIDIFGKLNTPVLSTTYGVVIFTGEIAMGGKVVAVLGPKWRVHYYAHLNDGSVFIGEPVWSGKPIGLLGDTGNAKGKQPHLHYSIVTLVPYLWRADSSTQGWKKTFFLDPNKILLN